jgi:hypothetical protein
MAKAAQFYLAAETIATTIDDQDIADAYVTLCVDAGIAAADAICCARLGQHALGDDHQEAVALLSKADRANAKHLKVLLDMKTRSGYSAVATSKTDQKRAGHRQGPPQHVRRLPDDRSDPARCVDQRCVGFPMHFACSCWAIS